MQILGICGSPRKNGNAEWLLRNFLRLCAEKGNAVHAVFLSETPLALCNGSLPEEENPQPYDDSMPEIAQHMLDADAIVFSSPTYFDNITPQLKNFIDRTDPFYEKLKDKQAVLLVVGQANEESQKAAADYLQTYCRIAGLQTKGVQTFRAAFKGDIQKVPGVMETLQRLVSRLMSSSL